MPTFITVLPIGEDADPYSAVQACFSFESLNAYNFYDSRNSQNVAKRNSDKDLGPKVIKNIRTGNKITCRMIELTDKINIDDSIKVPGCDHAAAFGFTTDVSAFIGDNNLLAAEKIKIMKLKKNLKESKKNKS